MGIDPVLPELRFSLRREIEVDPVVLEHVEHLQVQLRESARNSGCTKPRSSADVWYSGYSPCGVRVSEPTARSNPGEQYWRSSYP